MQRSDYRRQALVTCGPEWEGYPNLVLAALGLAGESGEVAEAHQEMAHLWRPPWSRASHRGGWRCLRVSIAAVRRAGDGSRCREDVNLEKRRRRYPQGFAARHLGLPTLGEDVPRFLSVQRETRAPSSVDGVPTQWDTMHQANGALVAVRVHPLRLRCHQYRTNAQRTRARCDNITTVHPMSCWRTLCRTCYRSHLPRTTMTDVEVMTFLSVR